MNMPFYHKKTVFGIIKIMIPKFDFSGIFLKIQFKRRSYLRNIVKTNISARTAFVAKRM